MKIVKEWIKKLADLRSEREFVFQEFLIHYSEQDIHYGDFNCFSFNLKNEVQREGKYFAEDLETFLSMPTTKNVSSTPINQRINTNSSIVASTATNETIFTERGTATRSPSEENSLAKKGRKKRNLNEQ